MQFLQAGLKAGERCLFISTEQTRDDLRESFAGYDFDLDHEELAITSLHASPQGPDGQQQVRLRTLDGGSVVDEQFVGFTLSNITEYLQRGSAADRIVFDSVSALEVLADQEGLFRRYLLELFHTLTDELEATTLLTAEADRDGYAEGVLEFSTHGVLRLTREAVNNDPHRFLEVAKMRGVDHDPRTVSSPSVAPFRVRRHDAPSRRHSKRTNTRQSGLRGSTASAVAGSQPARECCSSTTGGQTSPRCFPN
jgi:RecA-superfamily ATPases implicated in signal transduction